MIKEFSNVVFTLLPPDDIPDPDFDNRPIDEDEDDDDEDMYAKAVEGSYNKSYFIDESTQLFRFPNYNKDWQGLVSIRDMTPYKNQYFSYKSSEERKAFTIDDFESNFKYIVWEVQDFPDFLENLPPVCFNKGISKKEVLELFDDYEDYINGSTAADDYFARDMENTKAFQIGLLEKADKSAMKPKDLWENLPSRTIDEICQANGIQPTKRESANIKKLIEKNIPFPFEGAWPTQLLKDCYISFIDLYIDEIRRNTDHFHPLYFRSLWEAVKSECCNDDIEGKIKKILKTPYWEKRLTKVERPSDDDDDEDDE